MLCLGAVRMTDKTADYLRRITSLTQFRHQSHAETVESDTVAERRYDFQTFKNFRKRPERIVHPGDKFPAFIVTRIILRKVRENIWRVMRRNSE